MKKKNSFWVHHLRVCGLLGNHEVCSLPSILLIEFFSKVKLKIGIWTVRSLIVNTVRTYIQVLRGRFSH